MPIKKDIPRINKSVDPNHATSTPEWMVKIDDYLSSTIMGTVSNPLPEGSGDIDFMMCAELFGWWDEQARATKGEAANKLFASSSVQQSPITIILPSGSYTASLEQSMYSGSNINEIHLIRLGNIMDSNVPLQIVSYTTVKIESIQQELDEIVVSFRAATRQNTNFSYSQDGMLQGHNVSSFDFTTSASAFTAL